MSDIGVREKDLKREARQKSWPRCKWCGKLLFGQTIQFRVNEKEWECFDCSNQK